MRFTFPGEPKLVLNASNVAIYVLEGTLTLFWDSEKREAVVGSFLYQPRGTPHGFHVEGNTPARILYMTVPTGFDQFVLEHKLPTPESEPDWSWWSGYAGCSCTIDREG
jgi:Cupin domain